MPYVRDENRIRQRRKIRARVLSEKEALFVQEVCKDGNKTRAATVAKYHSPKDAGSRLVQYNQAVKDALKEVRMASVKAAAYNIDAAMKECEDAIEFARETENANAYVKAVELKSKLQGLLVEKHQIQQVPFTISIGGIYDELPAPPQQVAIEAVSKPVDESVSEEEDGGIYDK